MILAILIGIVIGYIFKPQIDNLLHKAIRYIKDKQNNNNDDYTDF